MSKVTKGNLYQNILGAYNILPTEYAIKYLTPDLSEASLMKIVFSKFASDTQYNPDNALYIEYILKSKFVASYDMEALVADTLYYEDAMRLMDNRDKDGSNPSSNTNIIDFDISTYASANVSSYLFYLDIICEIYAAAYDLKMSNKSLISNEIVLKSRYLYSDNNLSPYTLNNTGNFNMTIRITRAGINNEVTNIEVLSTQPVQAIFDKFNTDIRQHLTFLNGNDVAYADAKYLLEVKYFYMTCRLKLMYFIANSLRIFATNGSMSVESELIAASYITQYILPVFINYKTKALSLETDGALTKKNVEYTNTVLDTTNKLKKINDKIANAKVKLVKNQKAQKTLQEYIDKKLIINTVAKIIFAFVTLITIILMATNLGGNSKVTMSLVLTAIVLLAYIILYVLTRTIEKFDVIGTSGAFTKFPQTPANANLYVRVPFLVTRTSGSSSLNDDKSFWKVLDGNDSTAWNSASGTYALGKALNKYKDDYSGEYLIIDLGEYIILDNFNIKFGAQGKGPKSFKVYGTDHPDAWENPNYKNWILLSEQNNAEYDNTMTKNFEVDKIVCPDYVAYDKALKEALYKNAESRVNNPLSTNNETLLKNARSEVDRLYVGTMKDKDNLAIKSMKSEDLLALKKQFNAENEISWDCPERQKATKARVGGANRFFMIVVNELTGISDNLNIILWELYGMKNNIVKTTTIQQFNDYITMPYDYNNTGLIEWGYTFITEANNQAKEWQPEYDYSYKEWREIRPGYFGNVDVTKRVDGGYYGLGYSTGSWSLKIGTIELNGSSDSRYANTINVKKDGMKIPFLNYDKLKFFMTNIANLKIIIQHYQTVPYFDRKNILLAAIDNVGPIDKETLTKAMLDQAQTDYDKAVLDIEEANRKFEIAKAALEKAIKDKAAQLVKDDAEYQKKLAEANEVLARAELESAKKVAEAAAKEAEAERERLRLKSETDAKTTALQKVTELITLNNNAMDAFKKYMTAAEQTQYAVARSENAKLAYQIALDTSTRAITSAQAEVDARNAQSVVGYAEIAAKIKAAEEATAKANSDNAQSIKNHEFNQQLINQIMNAERKGLMDQIAHQTEQLRLANEAATVAENELRIMQNEISQKVSELNSQIGLNSSNIDQSTTDLRLRLIQERKRKADADAEYAQQQLEELRQKGLEAAANTTIEQNDLLIAEKNNSIKFYSDELKKSQEKLRLLQETKTDLQRQLRIKLETIGATTKIDEADKRLEELETKTKEKINDLKIEKAQLLIQYTNVVLQGELAAKDAIVSKNNKDELMKELEAKTLSKQQYQQEISNAKSQTADYNISEILGDVDVHVLYSINDNINSINNATVIPRLKREHQYFDQYNQAMRNYSFVTDSDRNIKKIDVKAMDDGTLFIVQLSLVIAFSCIIYHLVSPYMAFFTSIALFIVIIVIYYLNVMSNVRTKAENYYWTKPENSSDS